MTAPILQRVRFTLTGQVQGVGFRPFVYRLAARGNLTGWVTNDARGVTLEVQGSPKSVAAFETALSAELPPLARVHTSAREDRPLMTGEQRFDILPSEAGELADAQVTVDVTTCDDCLAELHDPSDPRHRYPFINCTNCGPRYTIVRTIPYDRPNTTMAEFAMCPLCAGQYADPADRRFHAQPVACPVCGPAVWIVDAAGRQVPCDDPIAHARRLLRDGKILAIKGLGGFHLACRADDGHAVARLRQRKRREAKPLAVMVPSLTAAATLCEVSHTAQALLTGPAAPIVLMPARPDAPIAPAVANGLDTLGVMLPATPLHHLLTADAMPPLVMTSGNFSDQPLIKDNEDAVSHFATLADAMLIHNRRIERRIDDSVVQIHRDGTAAVLRRARGYAPAPIDLETLLPDAAGYDTPTILAVGAELKNTVCFLRGRRAMLSEHLGDLKDGRVYRHFIDTINHLEALFEMRPQLLAADLHPQYLSSQYAQRRHRGELAARDAVAIELVQHHHAHVAACMAEHGRSRPVIGIACDGVGYGDDGAVWGCEILSATLTGYRRLGHLRYVPLPGGDAAATETARPALAALYDTFGPGGLVHISAGAFTPSATLVAATLEQITLDVNSPPTSSLGRWFDAVAFLAGVCDCNTCEARAPMLMEAQADPDVSAVYDFALTSTGPFTIDLRPMVEQLLADRSGGASAAVISAKFHNTAAEFLRASAARAREETGIETVALSGGCFANRRLTASLKNGLELDGFTVLVHHTVPTGDAGVALGQAVIAAARHHAAARAHTEKRDVSCDTAED